jgi:hypothetical protein
VIYVFTFLGEFGYELLNWQGVIRKFAKTVLPSDKIICCSRANLYPLYDVASTYVDISEVDLFKRSAACGYFALHDPKDLDLSSRRNVDFDQRLKAELRSFIYSRLRTIYRSTNHSSWWRTLLSRDVFGPSSERYTFVFSSDKTKLNGCLFGCDRNKYGVDEAEGNIYDLLDLNNNIFQKVEPDLRVHNSIEAQLGWNLAELFVLCQTRNREIVLRSKDVVPKEQLIEALAQKVKVVLISFRTGRCLDSYSAFEDIPNCFRYSCKNFVDQACLVHFAKHCVFFTEGDFGSHMYVPPFLGKNVTSIAPRSVYQLGTTPIDFWNRNVFRFGGQISPKVSEQVFSSRATILEVVDAVLPH